MKMKVNRRSMISTKIVDNAVNNIKFGLNVLVTLIQENNLNC
jgi:hypothetical protein